MTENNNENNESFLDRIIRNGEENVELRRIQSRYWQWMIENQEESEEEKAKWKLNVDQLKAQADKDEVFTNYLKEHEANKN
jgi:hypothetical protein